MLKEGSDDAFCMMGLARKISTGPGEPSTMGEALSSSNSGNWKQAMDEELKGLWEKGSFKNEVPPYRDKTGTLDVGIRYERSAERRRGEHDRWVFGFGLG